jgi:hypothetical protein
MHEKDGDEFLESTNVRVAEISIEVCDGRSSYVEQNLEEWLAAVRESYSPWGSKVVAIN